MSNGTKTVALSEDVHQELSYLSIEEDKPIRQLVDEILREEVLDGEGEYPMG